jgi:predicted Zn-dependent protease
MLTQIVEALEKRNDLAGWTVRHVRTSAAQMYAVPQGIESQRAVDGERYLIDVLCNTSSADGSSAVGSGNASLLPGDDIEAAINQAILVAGLVSNPIHGLPGPAAFPNISLCDEALQTDASAAMLDVMERIRAAVGRHPNVRLSAAECFGEIEHIHLVNSRGIDVEQKSTQLDIEFVLHAQKADRESETLAEMIRRRVADLDIEAALEARARHALDALEAENPPSWQGPVVLRNEALTAFMAGDQLSRGVIQTRASGASKYAGISQWELGKSVFRSKVQGDPLNVWANRTAPFGTASSRFDSEGLPAQRVEVIRENELVSFAASQRYADYLKIPATGDFGNIELPPGSTPSSDLLAEPYVEVVQFSWFFPNAITGDFATEIRFGYLVQNGIRKPFRGGQLIGNYMDALANVRWSTETGLFGAYLGPQVARFNELKVA